MCGGPQSEVLVFGFVEEVDPILLGHVDPLA
jgi:hypothetical protein